MSSSSTHNSGTVPTTLPIVKIGEQGSYISLELSPPFYFELSSLKDKGLDLQAQYQQAAPFPHIVIDDFLPETVLRHCLDRFPQQQGQLSESFDRDQERFKSSFQPDEVDPDIRSLLYALNSLPFIQFLQNLTGIDGLIADPSYAGGGLHETRQGGHLGIHADFIHHRKLNLERRVNMLIYLNEDWLESYGGQVELWDRDMKNCIQSVVPLFNRCVIFSTDATSWHGHPHPINHPNGKPRRSIAMYYYTATWDDTRAAKTTQFKARPQTSDKVDWQVKTNEALSEFLPPILSRRLINWNNNRYSKRSAT